jgi:hypothetical protein
MKRLIRQAEAPGYLSFSEPTFNELVRPFVPEIRQGRMVLYDILDLDKWVEEFKLKNGKRLEGHSWQNIPQAYEKKAKSGTSKKSSGVNSFAKALENRNSNTPSDS